MTDRCTELMIDEIVERYAEMRDDNAKLRERICELEKQLAEAKMFKYSDTQIIIQKLASIEDMLAKLEAK